MPNADINLGITNVDSDESKFPARGTTVKIAGKKYCRIYNAGAASITVGLPVGVFLTTPGVASVSVTAATMVDTTDATTTRSECAGVGLGTIATTESGWIQVGGLCENLTTDGNVVAGDWVVLEDGAATVVRDVAAATNHFGRVGFAPVADSSAVGTIFLTNCAFDY